MRRALLLAIGVALAAAAPAGASPAAHVWVTTPDGAMKMSDRGSVPFRPGGSGALTISVDPSRRYQTMEGFGASITDSSAHLLARLDRRTRNATMRSLFRTNGLSFLRQPMGASDFVAGDHYTYDDLPAGQTDYGMRRFSIAHDRKEILPLLRQALALNPKIKVIGVAVEPAGVDEDQPVADRRAADRRAADLRRLRALLRQVRAGLQARGRPGLRAHGPERAAEPQAGRLPRHGHAGGPAGEADRGARAGAEAGPPAHQDPRLRPQLVDASRRHRLDAARARSRRPSTRRTCWRAAPARWIDGTAFHCYAGDPSRQTELQRRLPRQGHLVHRVLGLARPDRPAGAGLLRHAEVAHAQPRARRHPQLGQDGRELEPRARPRRRPAQRRLRYLHRRRHRRARARP